MRKREKELLWELPLALIALGGISAVIDAIPKYVVLGIFSSPFIIMLVTWILRFKDVRYPVKMTFASIRIDTLDARRLLKQKQQGRLEKSVGTIEIIVNDNKTQFVKGENIEPQADPFIEMEVTLFSDDAVRISRKVTLRLDRAIENELKALGRLHTHFQLRTDDNDANHISLKEGEHVTAHAEMPLQLNGDGFTDEVDNKLDMIGSDLEGKFKVGWRELGHKMSWYRPGKNEL